jgi:hypothetical protein
MLIKIIIILIITIFKQHESAVPDNDGEANIISEILKNYKNSIRYLNIFSRIRI